MQFFLPEKNLKTQIKSCVHISLKKLAHNVSKLKKKKSKFHILTFVMQHTKNTTYQKKDIQTKRCACKNKNKQNLKTTQIKIQTEKHTT